jgi:DNA-binding NarL/FixJ family response regulator
LPYGYLIKPVSERELAATLEMAFHRLAVDRRGSQVRTLPGDSSAGHSQPEELSAVHKRLTARQQEIFDLLLAGYTLKKIAVHLQITVQAVWKHQQRIFATYGVRNEVELIGVLVGNDVGRASRLDRGEVGNRG